MGWSADKAALPSGTFDHLNGPKLWYHAESDSVFVSDEWDGLSENVTSQAYYRMQASHQGIDVTRLLPLEVTSGIAAAIVESYKRWERKPADLYPTPVDVTESLMPVLHALDVETVWEPACGDGRMARVMEWHGFQVDATDLRDAPGYGTGGIDFLRDVEKDYGWISTPDMIVTNPPFSLAEQFIRKALTITPNVAMLLKATYWNTKGRIAFFEEHRPKLVLPLTWRAAFLPERGSAPLMDCCWVVWHSGDEDYCVYEPLPKLVYPGYHGKGLKGAMANLEEALGELSECLAANRKG